MVACTIIKNFENMWEVRNDLGVVVDVFETRIAAREFICELEQISKQLLPTTRQLRSIVNSVCKLHDVKCERTLSYILDDKQRVIQFLNIPVQEDELEHIAQECNDIFENIGIKRTVRAYITANEKCLDSMAVKV